MLDDIQTKLVKRENFSPNRFVSVQYNIKISNSLMQYKFQTWCFRISVVKQTNLCVDI